MRKVGESMTMRMAGESMWDRERRLSDYYRIRLCRHCGHRATLSNAGTWGQSAACPRCRRYPDGRRAPAREDVAR